MLSDFIDVLADPADGSALDMTPDSGVLRSASGREYPVSPEGYVALVAPDQQGTAGDDVEMVTARETFLSRGHYAPFVEAVTAAVHCGLDDAHVADGDSPVIVEVGAGTGYYLSHTLDDVDDSRGIGIDVSVPAVEKLSGCHPRALAVVADVLQRLPLQDSSVDIITTVFAPANMAEFARVLKPGGQAIVLTAEAGHLKELREPLGIIDAPAGKAAELVAAADPWFIEAAPAELLQFRMRLDQESIATQTGMSPSAQHIPDTELAARVAQLPEHMELTARATLTRLQVR